MASLKVNEGLIHSMGRVSGQVMGAAFAWDKGISSDVVRYGTIGAGALAGLWGAADPGDMGGMRGAIGAAGAGYATFAGGGAWLNKGGMNKVMAEAYAKEGVMDVASKGASNLGRYWSGLHGGLHEGAAWGGAWASKVQTEAKVATSMVGKGLMGGGVD